MSIPFIPPHRPCYASSNAVRQCKCQKAPPKMEEQGSCAPKQQCPQPYAMCKLPRWSMHVSPKLKTCVRRKKQLPAKTIYHRLVVCSAPYSLPVPRHTVTQSQDPGDRKEKRNKEKGKRKTETKKEEGRGNGQRKPRRNRSGKRNETAETAIANITPPY